MSDRRIRIVTRGDDIGSFHGANIAALQACENGLLRNLSVMACAPYAQEAFDLLGDVRSANFGIHLMINAEWENARWKPVLPASFVPSLVEADGSLRRDPKANKAHGVVFKEIMAELQAQLDRLRSIGFTITYADMHMGFGWLYEEDEQHRLAQDIREWVVGEGLINAEALPGLREFPRGEKSDEDPVLSFIRTLQSLTDGTYLLVTHPACDDPQLRTASSWGERLAIGRDWDRQRLCDERVLHYCRDNGIEPITYQQAAQSV